MKNYGHRFWNKYLTVLNENRIHPKQRQWYMRWAKRFVQNLNDFPIDRCEKTAVQNYIQGLLHYGNYERWQVEQASDSLRLLFQKMLKLNWAEPWSINLQQSNNIVLHKKQLFPDSMPIGLKRPISNGFADLWYLMATKIQCNLMQKMSKTFSNF